MKRILFAAVTALSIHGLLFAIKFPGLSEKLSERPFPRVLSMRLMGTPHPRKEVMQTVQQRRPVPPRQDREETPSPSVKDKPVMPKQKDLPVSEMKKIIKVSAPPEAKNVPPKSAANPDPLSKLVKEESLPAERPSQSGTAPGDSAAVLQEAMPLYRVNTPPPYPRRAREQGKEGTVMLDVRVDRQGHVQEVRLATSSGSSLLDSTALASVEQWLFEPARRGTEPVEKWVRIPIRFDLQSQTRPRR